MPYFNTMWIYPGNYSTPDIYGGINNINFNGNKVTWYSQEYTDNRGTAEKQFNLPPTQGTISVNGYIDYNYYFYLAIG